MKQIRELKRGEFFKLSPGGKTVYVRGDYERTERKYSCTKFDDINDERFFNGDKWVFVDFCF